MGIVYLLGDSEKENTFKIGVTRGKLENRIKKLQTGNSGEIYVVNYYETKYPFYLEKHLHFKFNQNNIKNEWFNLDVNEIVHFKEYCEDAEKLIEVMKDNPFFQKNLK